MYFYKGVNVNFFIMFKILSKLQELPCSKIKQNLCGEYMFYIIQRWIQEGDAASAHPPFFLSK